MIWKPTLFSSLLWLATFAILYAQRKSTAEVRYRTCLVSLVACLIVWSFSVIPAQWLPQISTDTLPRPMRSAPGIAPVRFGSESSSPQPTSANVPRIQPAPFNWGLPLRVMYGVGVTASVALWLFAWIYWIRLARSGRACDCSTSKWRTLFVRQVEVPLCVGWPCQAILLPEIAEDWDPMAISLAVRHEESHLQRYDHVWISLAHLLCAAQWFNPLAWLFARRLRLECERVADEAVLATGVRPSIYTEFILAFVNPQRGLLPFGSALPLFRKSDLAQRLESILSPLPRSVSMNQRRILVISTVSLASVVVGCGFTFANWKSPQHSSVEPILTMPGNTPYPQYQTKREVEILQIGLKENGREIVWDSKGLILPQNKVIEHEWKENQMFGMRVGETGFPLVRYRHIVYRVRANSDDGSPVAYLWEPNDLKRTISPDIAETEGGTQYLGVKDGWHYFVSEHGIYMKPRVIGSHRRDGTIVKDGAGLGDAGIYGVGKTAIEVRVEITKPVDEGSVKDLPLFSPYTASLYTGPLMGDEGGPANNKDKNSRVWSKVAFWRPTLVSFKPHFFRKNGQEIPDSLIEGEFFEKPARNHRMLGEYYVGVAPSEIGDIRISSRKVVDVEVGNIPMSPRQAP